MATASGSRKGGYPSSAGARREFVAKHLVYEIEMVLNTTALLARVSKRIEKLKAKAEGALSIQEKVQLVTYYSLLESWTIHNRLLSEFFQPRLDGRTGLPFVDGRRGHPATAAAEDFVRNHKEWVIWRAGEERLPYKRLTNERIAHLSYGRLSPQTPWKMEYAIENMKAARRFVSAADEAMVAKATLDRLRPMLDLFLSGDWVRFVNRLPPPDFPPADASSG